MMRDAPLFRFNHERSFLIEEVTRRVYNDVLLNSRRHPKAALEFVLNEIAFQESERLRSNSGPGDEIRSRGWWRQMARNLREMTEDEKRDVLKELVHVYTEDTAGKFDPKVFKFANNVLPVGLSFLFKTQDLRQIPGISEVGEAVKHLRDLEERVVVEGNVEHLRKLARRGTLVVVPTHSSNMDSIVFGWALENSGLPPVTYGAGKNLFTNPLTSFFMHNLGAYKVDRRIQHDLYKHVLKAYSQVLLERGYHSLFFPGGTRCRSNIVEKKLKLGLLGTSVTAYTKNLQAGKDQRIYVCPATINYNLVLEAESLIKEHLRREGGAQYLLENDEFNQISTVIRFVLNTVKMSATTVICFGEPMDVFGNAVGLDGESLDDRGRLIDPAEFVRSVKTGEIVEDATRDREYTRYTGTKIADSFQRNTVLLPASVVGLALFELLRARFPKLDVYQLVRMNFEETIPWHEIRAAVGELVSEFKVLRERGKVHLSSNLDQPLDDIVDQGILSLTMYHIPAAIDYVPSGVRINKVELLLFYANRASSFGIDTQELIKRAITS